MKRKVHGQEPETPMRLTDWIFLSVITAMLLFFIVVPWFGWDPVGAAMERGFNTYPLVMLGAMALLVLMLLRLAVRRFRRTGELADLMWSLLVCAVVVGTMLVAFPQLVR